MARVTGPLFSMTARGKIADALVYAAWKGIDTVRSYVVPANPKTAAQVAQRALMTAGVSAWKNSITDAEGRSAWDREALKDSRPMSGFNSFTSSVVKMMATDPDTSYGDSFTELGGRLVEVDMLNVDDGAAGDEAGNFEIWNGTTPSNMTLLESVAIIGAKVTSTVAQGVALDVVYCQLRKDSLNRTGIMKLALIA